MSHQFTIDQLSFQAKIGKQAWQSQLEQQFFLSVSFSPSQDNTDSFEECLQSFDLAVFLNRLQEIISAQVHSSLLDAGKLLLSFIMDAFHPVKGDLSITLSQSHPHTKVKSLALTLRNDAIKA